MVILGLNAYHGDSAAAILVDGKLVAAVEEERFRRIKHWAGFPSESIQYCLDEARVSLSDVQHVAINQDSNANRKEKLIFALRNRLSPAMVLKQLRNRRKRDSVADRLRIAFPQHPFTGTIHAVEHHQAHLSSAFHVSPFEQALAVSVDGFGDFASAAWGMGSGTNICINNRVLFPHSLGIFYQAITQYLGFPHYGDEYKVMGLAPYGKPSFLSEMSELVKLLPNGGYELDLKYFVHHKKNVASVWDDCVPAVSTLYSDQLAYLLGPVRAANEPLEQRHHDIARSAQAMYEQAFFHLLNTAHAANPIDDVVISGGCGMNSVANGKVRANTPFKNVYIQSAAGDAGGAIGSAVSVWHKMHDDRVGHMAHSYWGPGFSDDEVKLVLDTNHTRLDDADCQVQHIDNDAELFELVAGEIAQGQVVGWFQGRMEWGPRALGNRSILGDPRRSDMKEILNLKIKRRESFRPFAPSILREDVAEWFETDADVPFMMQVFQIRETKRALIPAVTHVDGSGRLQTVTPSINDRYCSLIKSFKKLTGIPMLLNTSFNENEPVVCTPEQALDCFLRTEMDVLVLQNWVIKR